MGQVVVGRYRGARDQLDTNELGHALGYDHVDSRISILNPRIGSEPTEFDRRAARMAFQRAPFVSAAAPCPEP